MKKFDVILIYFSLFLMTLLILLLDYRIDVNREEFTNKTDSLTVVTTSLINKIDSLSFENVSLSEKIVLLENENNMLEKKISSIDKTVKGLDYELNEIFD